MRRLTIIALSLAALVVAPAADAQAKKKRKKKKAAAAASAGASRAELDAAIGMLKSGSFEQAAVALHAYRASQGDSDEATYNLGKSLYRANMYHSALHYFADLLQKGPSNRYYNSALEWCLFISRKLKDDRRVNRVVARYSTGNFPEQYRDEFLFRLARYHYAQAVAIESGAIVGQLGETRVEDTVTGGKSFQGDLFADDGGGETAPDAPKVTKKDDGGLSFDEDLFGDPGEKKPEPKKKKQKKKGKSTDAGTLNAKEHTEAAEKFVIRVKEDSKYGARAKFLQGLVLYKVGKENEALDAFKTVVRLTKEDGPQPNEALREAAFFQLARTHFGAQQPSFSIFYYSKIDRDSYEWLDALYEASWAEFRLLTYEKALGNLMTLHAPFFTEEYYPESHILKAVIYYENCRYPEAKDILTSFLRRYEPVLEELKAMTAREQTSDKYYEALENLRTRDLAGSDTEKAKILSQVLSIALSDPELERLDTAYKEVESEQQSIAGRSGIPGSDLGIELERILGDAKLEVRREAGRAVRTQLERERDNIKTLIAQAIRIDIETSRSEQERIESQLREVDSKPKDIEKEYIEWTDDEKLVWPFDGEYWRDELGTYEVTLARSCR